VSADAVDKLVAAFNLLSRTIISTGGGADGDRLRGRQMAEHVSIDTAIVNAATAPGRHGDVAILTAANRMQLMPFARSRRASAAPSR
jgi:Na+/citrate or Na+/malate symporter